MCNCSWGQSACWLAPSSRCSVRSGGDIDGRLLPCVWQRFSETPAAGGTAPLSELLPGKPLSLRIQNAPLSQPSRSTAECDKNAFALSSGLWHREGASEPLLMLPAPEAAAPRLREGRPCPETSSHPPTRRVALCVPPMCDPPAVPVAARPPSPRGLLGVSAPCTSSWLAQGSVPVPGNVPEDTCLVTS